MNFVFDLPILFKTFLTKILGLKAINFDKNRTLNFTKLYFVFNLAE